MGCVSIGRKPQSVDRRLSIGNVLLKIARKLLTVVRRYGRKFFGKEKIPVGRIRQVIIIIALRFVVFNVLPSFVVVSFAVFCIKAQEK